MHVELGVMEKGAGVVSPPLSLPRLTLPPPTKGREGLPKKFSFKSSSAQKKKMSVDTTGFLYSDSSVVKSCSILLKRESKARLRTSAF